jgi:hypothetical protein
VIGRPLVGVAVLPRPRNEQRLDLLADGPVQKFSGFLEKPPEENQRGAGAGGV